MSNHTHDNEFPDDLAPVARLLREQRPEATGLELDRMATRARAGATGTHRRRGAARLFNAIASSSAAVMATIALGALMGGTGVGLALTTSGKTPSAAVSQYRTPTPSTPTTSTAALTPTTTTDTQAVLPETASGSDVPPETLGDVPASGNEPTLAQSVPLSGERELPFTGLLVIPLLLSGAGLLVGGLFMRRSLRRREEAGGL
jgi:hypothetical protein